MKPLTISVRFSFRTWTWDSWRYQSWMVVRFMYLQVMKYIHIWWNASIYDERHWYMDLGFVTIVRVVIRFFFWHMMKYVDTYLHVMKYIDMQESWTQYLNLEFEFLFSNIVMRVLRCDQQYDFQVRYEDVNCQLRWRYELLIEAKMLPHYTALQSEEFHLHIPCIILLLHYTLQHAATHCTRWSTNLECCRCEEYHLHIPYIIAITLHTATRCNTLYTPIHELEMLFLWRISPPYSVYHCYDITLYNTLQRAATHCTHWSTNLECCCYKEYHVHCNTLQHTCNTPATHRQHTATHCNSTAHCSLECCCYEEHHVLSILTRDIRRQTQTPKRTRTRPLSLLHTYTSTRTQMRGDAHAGGFSWFWKMITKIDFEKWLKSQKVRAHTHTLSTHSLTQTHAQMQILVTHKNAAAKKIKIEDLEALDKETTCLSQVLK